MTRRGPKTATQFKGIDRRLRLRKNINHFTLLNYFKCARLVVVTTVYCKRIIDKIRQKYGNKNTTKIRQINQNQTNWILTSVLLFI
jgi:hypothetical protein